MVDVNLPSNQIQDFLNVVRRKTVAIGICGLAGLSISTVVLCFVSPKYSSYTRVVVSEVRFEEDPLYRNPQLTNYKDLQNIAMQMLTEPKLVACIREELRWSDYLAIEGNASKRQEYLEDVRKRCNVERAKKDKDFGDDYITVTYKDEDPRRAADFANTIAKIWMTDQKDSTRVRKENELENAIREQRQAQSNWTVALQQVRAWQETHRISPTQPNDRKAQSDEDPVYREAEQARRDLIAAQKDFHEKEEKFTSLNNVYSAMPNEYEEILDAKTAAAMPADPTRALVDQLNKVKEDISKLQIEQKGIKKFHPTFAQKQNEIDKKTKQQKEIEEKLSAAGVATTGEVASRHVVLNPEKQKLKEQVVTAEAERNAAEAELKRAEEREKVSSEQASKRPGVYERYFQLTSNERTLAKQFEAANDAIAKKRSILDQVNSPTGNPYKTTEIAVPSEKPVEPNIALFLAAGLLGGAGLGLTWIFTREFVRSTYRSAQDAAASLSLPVLGFVNQMATRLEVRRRRQRQVVAVTVSLSVILLIGGSASLYLLQPKLLPASMRAAIDSVKTKLR